MFELGPNARVAFAALYLGGQIALIATAGRRADAAFGFRMFSESSTLHAALYRAVEAPSGYGTLLVPVVDGSWMTRDADGNPHRIRWHDRVRAPELNVFDATIHAGYGAAAQTKRWQAALDDVAAHIPEDAETRQLVLDLTLRRNGHEPVVLHLVSKPRG